MMIEWFTISWLAGVFLVLFAFAEVLYRFADVKAELTRKITHIGTGVLSLLFPVFLSSHWSVALLSFCFLVILVLSLVFNFLPSINNIDRTSYGSILYPFAVYISFFIYEWQAHQLIFFYLPVLTLAICDPLAAFVGKNKPFGKYKRGTKTLAGSSAFFFSAWILASFLLSTLTLEAFSYQLVLQAFALALLATVLEAISKNGIDNILIPVGVLMLSLYFFT